ncbi:putative polysaccharide export protein [Phaeomoniella chlamydospora]|uniref:Putative polysaccharide export protein n=1 Tax=Phaeomoniella chlamydospora TaxID=158046 RepID=A0A0G2F4D7_PHACM|nr:putative polysaccharide export protein [Phaeomoniella chlamydospora]
MPFLLRPRRRPLVTNAFRLIGFLIVATTLLDLFRVRHAQSSYQLPEQDDDAHRGTRLFIAATHWNNEAVLRSRWNDAILEIAQYFGPKNVYVSIHESGSWDDTKGALRELEATLNEFGVGNTIVLDTTTHKDEVEKTPSADDTGWIDTSRGKKELRRIPYLAKIRNKALEPLVKMAAAHPPQKFDNILFLNDVYFSVPQVLDLLSTNNGHYAAVCALDFSRPPSYYDTFALRDSAGEEPMMPTWPYFRSSTSRSAMKLNTDVPVSSCWNGMVIMPVEPFYDKLNPLRFRGVNDKLAAYHLEASECCLIHSDNPYTPSRGVWLNPRVRVGYNEAAYKMVKDANWLGSLDIVVGLWRNRILRWSTTSWFTKGTIRQRLKEYTKRNPNNPETGTFCLINEMQVLVENGWAHV